MIAINSLCRRAAILSASCTLYRSQWLMNARTQFNEFILE